MLGSIKKLRELTGFGMNDCKKALDSSEGDMDKALSWLKEKGAKILAKKKERTTNQGLVEAYIHFSQGLGAMVEVNCETDFVAKNEDFKKFVKDLAVHIAAVSPKYVSEDTIPAEDLENLTKAQKEEFCKANCLLSQPFVKDSSLMMLDYLNSVASKFRENIVIKRFVRFSLGE